MIVLETNELQWHCRRAEPDVIMTLLQSEDTDEDARSIAGCKVNDDALLNVDVFEKRYS